MASSKRPATIYKTFDNLTRKYETVSANHLHLLPANATVITLYWSKGLGCYVTVPAE